jgi:hypothetical protein
VNTGFAPSVGKGFFPLDEELGLLPGGLTPLGHEQLVRLAGWMPFERAAELFTDFTGIAVSEAMSRRYTEEAGAAYVDLQEEAVEQLEREKPSAPHGVQKAQVSVDGAMVPLVKGEWAEAKTLVIAEVQPAVKEKEEWVVHTQALSYFSRLASAEEFGRLALVEMHWRGVENAREVAAVQDGADWEQGFVDYHCPRAVRILDFAHAAEHLNLVGQALYGENTPQAQQWLQERLHKLKAEGPEPILAELDELAHQQPQSPEIAANLTYLKKRQAQLQYPRFRDQGWPIGSGIVESGNNLVVEARLKGSGMHWACGHVNPMLALRNILCSDRWKQAWPTIATRLQHPQPRIHPTPSPVSSSSDRPAPPMPRQYRSPGSLDFQKKTRQNPWRLFKVGRSLYHPENYPKK